MAVKVVSAYYLSMLLVIIGHDLDTDRLNAATSNQHNMVWYNVGTKTEIRSESSQRKKSLLLLLGISSATF